MADASKTERTRTLNDTLRRTGQGGQVFITCGINALGNENVAEIMRAVATFDGFSPDHDPYGEHDCAVMDVGETRIIWKIDYYNRAREYASPDPSDPDVTCRILTVMLAEEY